ncbi:MAG: hypothetical protein DRN53_06955, partial [Thermoprotei archaeon]
SISDRVAIMRRGRIVQVGRPSEIYMNPRNLFVATFIGRSTALRGSIEYIQGRRVKMRVNEKLTITGKLAEDYELSVGDKAIAIMHPEDFTLKVEGESNIIEGVVELTMFLGPFTQLRINVGDQNMIAYIDPEYEVKTGTRIRLAIKEEDVIIFPLIGWEEFEVETIT